MTIEVYSKKNNKIKITFPTKKNGSAVAKLIQRCPPLDLNSTYNYLIQSYYFNRTCSVAFDSEKIVAFVSGFIKPTNKNCLFIWQVAIDEEYRGKGLGIELIEFLLNQNKEVNTIETTITKNNIASRRMFQKIVEKYKTRMSEEALVDKEKDFSNEHDSEMLITIGPIKIKVKNENI
jgi:L-2,4-diaminobutyric acid acetyltransferase